MKTTLEWKTRAENAENAFEQVAAILEAIEGILAGHAPSDFMESFPVVRAVADLKLHAGQEEAYATEWAERGQIAEAAVERLRRALEKIRNRGCTYGGGMSHPSRCLDDYPVDGAHYWCASCIARDALEGK